MSDQTTSTAARGGPGASRSGPEKPSAMQGREFLYGQLVAAVLIAVAIANFVIRHGAGAPKHPQTGLQILGLLTAVALVPIMFTRNRFIAPFAAVIAAFFVTFPTGPSTVRSLHVVAIIFPLIYALLLTQRQRKAAIAQAKAGAATRQPSQGRRRRSRRSKESDEVDKPRAPQPSRRYTPPKDKRAKR